MSEAEPRMGLIASRLRSRADFHRKSGATYTFYGENDAVTGVAAAALIEQQAAEIARLRKLYACAIDADARITRLQDALRGARNFAKAHEAWEADVIINADWGEHGLDETPRLTAEQWDKVIEVQTKRNDALATIDAALSGAGQ